MNVRNLAIRERSATEIQDWMVTYLADLLEMEPKEIDMTVPFEHYGLDSSAAVGLTGDLEEWLSTEIDPTVMYDYPSIEALAQHLSQHLSQH
jgi:acyl carrier protein